MRPHSLLLLAAPSLAFAAQSSLQPSPTAPFELHDAPLTPTFGEALLDDSIPLPNEAVVAPGRDGDRVIGVASGDPHFLGFAAGRHYPPADERVDPRLMSQLGAGQLHSRPRDETYGFVMFAKRITEARKTQLEDLGARVLEFHPHYTLKVALDPTHVDEIAQLDFVRWVGVAQPWQKLHPVLARSLDGLRDGELADVYIDLFDSDLCAESQTLPYAPASFLGEDRRPMRLEAHDAVIWQSNGWQQRALEELGVEIVEYIDSIRAFRARIAPASLEPLVELDFVQFVEPCEPIEAHVLHDQSMPMVNADIMRTQFNGAFSQYAVVGFADSGFYFQHPDLLHSLGLGWDFSSAGDPWADGCGHGTHVVGTIFGSGNVTDEHAGAAPGLGTWHGGYFFNARIFNNSCSGSVSLSSVMNVLHTPFTFNNITTPKPHVQNHSWGSISTGGWLGTEADPRLLDGEVYTHGQLLCFSAGNDGPSADTLTQQASSKNVLTVGSVLDHDDFFGDTTGEVSTFSSRGPTGDGRWKPNVCAVGERVTSLLSGSSGYTVKDGTSMAAPHVAGVASQLVDAKTTQVGYRADLIAALLMASSIQRNNAVISTELDAHLQSYGVGRIDARRAIQNTPQWTMQSWNFNQGSSNSFADFTVPSGTTRMVVCMRYHEPAASAGASRALVNDFDLYLDMSPFTASNTASGDYWAHASALDNTEFRVLDNPSPGLWRWKNWPASVGSTCRVSVVVALANGDITPTGALTVLASDTTVRPNDPVSIDAYYTAGSYTAASVVLDTTSTGAAFNAAETFLYDGRVADQLDNDWLGHTITIGNVPLGVARRTRWIPRWTSEGVKTFRIDARSENADAASNTQTIYVDGTGPTAPATLSSSTHPVNAMRCGTSFSASWTAASDAVSGVAGYLVLLDTSSSTQPTVGGAGVSSLPASTTSWNTTLTPSLIGYWLHVRAFDACDNLGATKHYGPFFAHGSYVQTYCTGKTNSLGCVPSVGFTGTPKIVGGNLTARCTSVLNQKNGLMFWGLASLATPFQGGTLCVASPTVRTPNISSGGSATGNNCTGSYQFTFTQSYIQSVGLSSGDVVHCQFWMRDPSAATQTGLSNALRFALCD